MPPLPPPPPPTLPSTWTPRVIAYLQTYHSGPDPQKYHSLLPLLSQPSSLTHLILSAVHLNPLSSPHPILTLNNDAPTHPKFTQLWDEILVLRETTPVRVLCMLGGAAKGTYALLAPGPDFETYYGALRDFLGSNELDGIDLDVEEDTPLSTMTHLIDRLRLDFGRRDQNFIITLAPVATALMPAALYFRHLSGFSYHALERSHGDKVDWYNVQFYNGWTPMPVVADLAAGVRAGNTTSTPTTTTTTTNTTTEVHLAQAMARTYTSIATTFCSSSNNNDDNDNTTTINPRRVVLGLLTSPAHGGSGHLSWPATAALFGALTERFPDFGGVMGWELWRAKWPRTSTTTSSSSSSTPSSGAAGSAALREAWRPLLLRWMVRRRDAARVEGGGFGGGDDDDDGSWNWAAAMRVILGMREVRDLALRVRVGWELRAAASAAAGGGGAGGFHER